MTTTQYRTRRSRAQWQALVEKAAQSAVSIGEFCCGEHISVSSFYQWRKRLATEQWS